MLSYFSISLPDPQWILWAIFPLAAIFRLFFGKHSTLCRSITASLDVGCVFLATVLIYIYDPFGFSHFLAPLPFLTFESDSLFIMNLYDTGIAPICSALLSAMILSLTVQGSRAILPHGNNFLSWCFWRCASAVLSIGVHFLVSWILNFFLPGVIASYASVILIVLLVGSLAIGLLNGLLTLLITFANPIFGILYAFFFSNRFGKSLSRAAVASALMAGLVLLMNYLQRSAFQLHPESLHTLLPILCIYIPVFYFTDRK